ncbi:hypothetical protein, partial [Streptomyces lunaelactis]|uniref:hypothetical protein n=1 Tax=Streptomyces lunaelactis TaxID=1535768 RepID=UPI001C2FC29E
MAVAAHPTRDLLVATGAEGKMAWWTVEGDSQLKEVEPENDWNSTWGGQADLTSLSFRPDGERLAAAYNGEGNGGALLRKTVAAGAELLASQAELGTALASEPAQSLVFSRDGRHLAVGDIG